MVTPPVSSAASRAHRAPSAFDALDGEVRHEPPSAQSSQGTLVLKTTSTQ